MTTEKTRSAGAAGMLAGIGLDRHPVLAVSLFSALKNELVDHTVLRSRNEARLAVAEYIEVFNNRQRLHSGLGYKTPLEVATEYQQNSSLAA